MKVTRIAVVSAVVIGLAAATVHAGMFNANITGKVTAETSGVIASKSFSSKNLISGVTTSKTAKLVVESTTGALDVVDQCGNLITNILTIVGTDATVGPDSKSNEVDAVELSFAGSGATNGTGIVAISNGTNFKATENFQIAIDGAILVGKVTTSSAFKPAHTCP